MNKRYIGQWIKEKVAVSLFEKIIHKSRAGLAGHAETGTIYFCESSTKEEEE